MYIYTHKHLYNIYVRTHVYNSHIQHGSNVPLHHASNDPYSQCQDNEEALARDIHNLIQAAKQNVLWNGVKYYEMVFMSPYRVISFKLQSATYDEMVLMSNSHAMSFKLQNEMEKYRCTGRNHCEMWGRHVYVRMVWENEKKISTDTGPRKLLLYLPNKEVSTDPKCVADPKVRYRRQESTPPGRIHVGTTETTAAYSPKATRAAAGTYETHVEQSADSDKDRMTNHQHSNQ